MYGSWLFDAQKRAPTDATPPPPRSVEYQAYAEQLLSALQDANRPSSDAAYDGERGIGGGIAMLWDDVDHDETGSSSGSSAGSEDGEAAAAAAAAADARFVSLLLLLARRAGFEPLTARDVALGAALNTDFLWALFIRADATQLDAGLVAAGSGGAVSGSGNDDDDASLSGPPAETEGLIVLRCGRYQTHIRTCAVHAQYVRSTCAIHTYTPSLPHTVSFAEHMWLRTCMHVHARTPSAAAATPHPPPPQSRLWQ